MRKKCSSHWTRLDAPKVGAGHAQEAKTCPPVALTDEARDDSPDSKIVGGPGENHGAWPRHWIRYSKASNCPFAAIAPTTRIRDERQEVEPRGAIVGSLRPGLRDSHANTDASRLGHRQQRRRYDGRWERGNPDRGRAYRSPPDSAKSFRRRRLNRSKCPDRASPRTATGCIHVGPTPRTQRIDTRGPDVQLTQRLHFRHDVARGMM